MKIAGKVIEDSIQKGNSRRIVFLFTFENGDESMITINGVPADTDIPELMAQHMQSTLSRAQRNEFIKLLNRIDAGENPLSIVPEYNSQNDFIIWMLKRMANADGATAIKYAPMEQLFTDEQISAALGITLRDAATWREKVKALAAAAALLKSYDSGMRYEDVTK